MLFNKFGIFCLITASICVMYQIKDTESRAVHSNIHSDVIVTSWPENKTHAAEEPEPPGWMRQQLLRFGRVASRVGNAMGAHATKVTSAVDKVCEIVKTIIPLLAAVCHVGEFKFCSSTNDAPTQLNQALSPSVMMNLDEPDRRR